LSGAKKSAIETANRRSIETQSAATRAFCHLGAGA
jgi:hypothetical protein